MKIRIETFTGKFCTPEEANAAENKIDWFSNSARDKDVVSCSFAFLELEKYLKKANCIVERQTDNEDYHISIIPIAFTDGILDNKLIDEFKEEINKFRAKQLSDVGTAFPDSTEYAYQILKSEKRLVVIGATGVGCLYGAYALLRQLGFEFFAPGEGNELIPQARDFTGITSTGFIIPGFPGRRIYSWRKNRADELLVDWFGKAGVNMWGAENLVPGMRKRGIKLGCGNHDTLPALGYWWDYCISDQAVLERMKRNIIDNFKSGIWKNADYLDFIGGDMQPRCECENCRDIGNYADREIYLINYISKAVKAAFNDGYLNRNVPIVFYSYGETELPPQKLLPEDFNSTTTFPQMWTMRCWGHSLEDETCSKSWKNICYAGHPHEFTADRLSNTQIIQNLKQWREIVGTCGIGFYPFNEALYWQDSVYFTHFKEFKFLAKMMVPIIGYMHILPGTVEWGLKKLFWYVVSSLMRNPEQNPDLLIKKYFKFYFRSNADKVEKAARLLDKALIPIQKITMMTNGYLKKYPEIPIENIMSEDGHYSIDSSGETLFSLEEAYAYAEEAMVFFDDVPLSADDYKWIKLSVGKVKIYYSFFKARKLAIQKMPYRMIEPFLKILNSTAEELSGLTNLPRLSMPYKPNPSPLAATGLVDHIIKLYKLNSWELPECFTKDTVKVKTGLENVEDNPEESPVSKYDSPPNIKPLEDLDARFLESDKTIVTGLRNQGIAYLKYKNDDYWCVCGQEINDDNKFIAYDAKQRKQKPLNKIICFKNDKILWEKKIFDPDFAQGIGPYVNIIEIPEADKVIVTAVISNSASGQKGEIRVWDLLAGNKIWQAETETKFGGNGSVAGVDLNQDGRTELIFGLNGEIACFNALSGEKLWSFTGDADGIVRICHGSFAIADIDNDGMIEIIFGTEYGTRYVTERSSIYILSHTGKVKRAFHNIEGDLGSTNCAVCDVDGDKQDEILIASLNLVFNEPRHNSSMFCFENYLNFRYDPIPAGAGRFTVADCNNDGVPEACFISSLRDGGPIACTNPAIRIIKLDDSRLLHEIPIPRSWLSVVPLSFDFNGDGKSEFLIGTWYGSGYGCSSDNTFADIYIIDGSGDILFKKTFNDGIYLPALLMRKKQAILALPCYDGNIYMYKIKTQASFNQFICPAASLQRTGQPVLE